MPFPSNKFLYVFAFAVPMTTLTLSFAKVQQFFVQLEEQFAAFFQFVAGKLKNFKNLTLGEQIAYSCIGAGLLFLLIALVLFIV